MVGWGPDPAVGRVVGAALGRAVGGAVDPGRVVAGRAVVGTGMGPKVIDDAATRGALSVPVPVPVMKCQPSTSPSRTIFEAGPVVEYLHDPLAAPQYDQYSYAPPLDGTPHAGGAG